MSDEPETPSTPSTPSTPKKSTRTRKTSRPGTRKKPETSAEPAVQDEPAAPDEVALTDRSETPAIAVTAAAVPAVEVPAVAVPAVEVPADADSRSSSTDLTVDPAAGPKVVRVSSSTVSPTPTPTPTPAPGSVPESETESEPGSGPDPDPGVASTGPARSRRSLTLPTLTRPTGPRPARRRPTAPGGTDPAVASPTGLRRPGALVAIAAAVVVAIVGLGQLVVPSPTGAGTSPVAEPIASIELVCPVTTATDALTSIITAGVAPLPTVKDGVATLAGLTTKVATAAPLVITAPGQTVARVVTGKPAPAQLARATGSFAGGFGADQSIRSGQGSTRGLAASPCARPITDGWLIGGGSTVGRLTQVLLVNNDDRPAQVDLTVYGPGGLVPAPGGSGIVLPASSRTQVRLDSLAPNQIVTAVHVAASTGRIGVSALDQQADGLVPLGMSLLPATQPGLTVVIPDVPEPVASAVLHLLSPGVDTTVSLHLLTTDGTVVPAGIGTVDLQAGHVTSVDLAPVLAGAPAAVVVTASSPVVAGIEVGTGSSSTLREKDAAAGTPALSAPGVVVGLAGGALKHVVTVAAPAAAAEVRFDLYEPGSVQPAWTSTVRVAAGTIHRVSIPVTTPTASSILVVTPVSGGPVYVGREVTEAGARGPMLALAPIYPTRATTFVPPVESVPGSSIR